MQRVARLTSLGFDYLFGSELVSARSVATSLSCCYASSVLFTWLVVYALLGQVPKAGVGVTIFGIIAGILGYLFVAKEKESLHTDLLLRVSLFM
jgi:hypothetical protein